MPFTKNDNRINKNGRPNGAKNKLALSTRELIQKFVDDKFDEVVKSFDEIKEPKDKISLYLKFIEYCTPKLKSVDYTPVNEEPDEPLTIKIVNS